MFAVLVCCLVLGCVVLVALCACCSDYMIVGVWWVWGCKGLEGSLFGCVGKVVWVGEQVC